MNDEQSDGLAARSKLLIAGGALLLIVLGAVMALSRTTMPPAMSAASTLTLVADAKDTDLTDITASDPKTGQQRTITVSDVYRDHYHPAEFSNGEIYVIKRPGGDAAYMTDPTWTDELWKYGLSGQGEKIFSAQGLDFRASSDIGQIAIVLPDLAATGTVLDITDLTGHVLKSFDKTDITDLGPDEVIDPLLWSGKTFWFNAHEGQSLTHIFSLDTSNYSIVSYPTSDLGVTVGEFDLEPLSKTLVYTNFVSSLSVPERMQDVTLSLYQLTTGDKRKLLTIPSLDHGLKPAWTSTSSIEYIDADGVSTGFIQL